MYPMSSGVALALLLAGCGATPLYQVSSENNQGVPFYVQEQFDVRTYAYEEVFYELKAAGTFKPDAIRPEGGKKAPAAKEEDNSIVRVVVAYASDFDVVVPYYTSFLQDTNNVRAWKDTGQALLADVGIAANKDRLQLAPFVPLTLSAVTASAGATRARLVAVDRTRIQIPSNTKEYLNLNVPHGGSANGEVDLNADGTIGKGIAQKQDQLPAAIASAVGSVGAAVLGTPLNTLVAHFFAPAATAQAENGEKVTRVDFTITPIKRTYVVKVTKSVDVVNDGGADPCGTSTWESALATFDPQAKCRVELSMKMQRGDDKSAPDTPKNVITISGAISTGPADAGASP